MANLDALMGTSVRQGADFDTASAFVDWTFANFTDAEIGDRSLTTLWARFEQRNAPPAETDRTVVGFDGEWIRRF